MNHHPMHPFTGSADKIVRAFQVEGDPTLAAILADNTPPAIRARNMARTLDANLAEGEYDRLTIYQRTELRALVFGLDALAEQIEAAHPPRSRPGWWRRALGLGG